jgi:2,4-dienoyl-CoA reductase-like NADH-dependent reductase (Old Yellow Enzyme family)
MGQRVLASAGKASIVEARNAWPRARGGAAMTITEPSSTAPRQRLAHKVPAWDDSQIGARHSAGLDR